MTKKKKKLFLWKIIIFGWWAGFTVISRAEFYSQSAAAHMYNILLIGRFVIMRICYLIPK